MKIFIWVLLLVVLIGVSFLYIDSSSEISEKTATSIAVNSVLKKVRTDLKIECLTFNKEVNPGVLSFDFYEVHNAECGGDTQTSPLITTILVNLKTGESYNQPLSFIDNKSLPWKEIKIKGSKYSVTDLLSPAIVQ
jgi:hypothetical protein